MEFEERYFREELDYLRQLSKLLATEKPHLARFLAEKDADPDIERLLEGVAFLTGNLRQKIEDEFPELTHGLIKMLWPNYLRPVPAMTLIEYTPDMDKSSVLDTFYQQNLKLFIDNDLSLEDGDNNVIIREDIIAQLETAQKIRDIFFSKQNGLGTSFAVETVSLSGNKRRSVLNLDGQLVDYSQGRNYTAHLVWPNNMREGNESKLTLIGTSGNAPRSISFSGPWAQFRLFGAGQLTGVQDGNFTVRFSVDGGAMTYRVHTDTEDNPFSGGLFSQFGLSDTLY